MIVFADPLLNQTSCTFQPAASNESHILYSWGQSTYGLANLTAYNNLTTLIEPIITVLLTPNAIINDERWAKAQIMCLRTGENVADGSVPAPKVVPGSSGTRPHASSRLLAGLLAFSYLGVVL